MGLSIIRERETTVTVRQVEGIDKPQQPVAHRREPIRFGSVKSKIT